jgi:hypothetical protein
MDWLVILLGLTPLWLILACPIIWPSMVDWTGNEEGNCCFLDLATLKRAFAMMAIGLAAKAVMGPRGFDVAEISAAILMAGILAIPAALWVHIIWRRKIRPLRLPHRSTASARQG